MSLKPVLKLKVDELFHRWLGETDALKILKENLLQIQHGEPLSLQNLSVPSPRNGKPMSPRCRPGSPNTPPCSPTGAKVSSPRSPRKFQKQANKQLGPSKLIKDSSAVINNNKNTVDSTPAINHNNNSIELTSVHSAPYPSPRLTNDNTAATCNTVNNNNRKNIRVPAFHFPQGVPPSTSAEEEMWKRVSTVFGSADGGKVYKIRLETVTKACGIPLYWKNPIFLACNGDKTGYITQQSFTTLWRRVYQSCFDDATKFVKLLAKAGTNYLESDDFNLLIQDVVETHPGLTFLQDAPEFHSRYVNTVISRIFYTVNRSWTGRITIPELRRSNFLQVLRCLEDEDDINQIVDYFSYEHFYVIYCKFWELDKDHDLFISKDDLARHNDAAISTRMIDRIFSGAVTRGKSQKNKRMSYNDFVWFLISEEDKTHATSIEYWFRCMDLDGDGILSMYEMEYFYEEQVQRMESMGIETLPFEDCLCQMLDIVTPKDAVKITLSDLKACKLTPIFFDTFFNLEKYLDHEQRDPFANMRDLDSDGPEMSDWERFASEEYEVLVAEEGGAPNDDEINYDDDFEPEDEELMALDLVTNKNFLATAAECGARQQSMSQTSSNHDDDDMYDFSTKDLGY